MADKNSIKLPISFVILTMLLLIPALFINLGLVSFNEDEGTFGTVAFEMIQGNDYVTPTISGEDYFSQPPLYNWVIALSFKLFGDYSNLALRFPMAIFTLIYGLTIFLFFRKRFGQYPAFIVALSSITCGRMIFYDSLHGLVDIPFALLTFVLFISIFGFYEKKKFYLLFIVAYFISAVTFLMNGLPSILFLGVSLVTLFIFKKDFKRLVTLPHLVGFLVFVVSAGGYYLAYELTNPGQLETVFQFFLLESIKNSLEGIVLKDTLFHFVYFPVEYWKDFLPGTLFIFFFFKKGTFKNIWKEEYIRYLAWIFATNFFMYWILPDSGTRSLLMLMPLFYGILIFMYFTKVDYKEWWYKSMRIFILVFLVIALLLPFLFFLVPETKDIPNIYFKVSFLFFFLLTIFYVFYHQRQYQLLTFFLAFVVLRIAFNWFVLPDRYEEAWQVRAEKEAKRLGSKYANKELYIVDTPSPYHESNKSMMDLSLFYLSRERGEIIELSNKLEKGALYLMKVDEVNYREHRVIDELFMNNSLVLYIVELRY